MVSIKVAMQRRSHRKCSVKKICSSEFRKFYWKAPVLKPLFNEVAGFRLATSLKRDSSHWCIPEKLAKFLRTPILKNMCERLIL